jgi:WD40 repeat protein
MASLEDTVASSTGGDELAPVAELGPGAEVDHFRIVRLLGRGGMGEVFLARDTQLGRKVALKLITSVGPQSPDAVARFLHEARTTAMFSHPNIVTLYAVGEHAGRPYVALEYLEGESLRERLDTERLAPAAALRVMHSVALAAAEAHANGVLHRDLKPENILLPRDGRVRVLDFGLAKPTEDGSASPADALLSTANLQPERVTHGIAGSPAYMAPEQWRGAPSTPATDVWALGVMLYELLAGRRPQEATQLFALCIAVTSAEPTPALPSDVPVSDAVRALVDRCLKKAPAERPTTSEVVETLEAAVHPTRAVAASASPFRGLLPFVERNAALYFGRDDEIASFVERLRDQPALAVVGASGAGKSSFVQAGVLPRLREEGRWHSFVMRPGRDPFGTLATRLLGGSTTLQVGEASSRTSTSGVRTSDGSADAEKLARELRESPAALVVHLQRIAERDGSRVLLVIDQLEELYGLVEDETIRAAFLSAVCAAADDAESPVRVVFTLREDFLTRIAGLPETRGVLGQFVVLRQPDERGLRQMIERPVERAGYRFSDDALVADMVESVRGEPASLPLLQFACTKLWEARDEAQKLLTRAAYDAFGGVAGALAHHADALLGTMTDEQQKLARSLLLRLVSAEGTRRVQTRSEVLDGLPSDAMGVLDKLVEARLLTARRRTGSDDAVELAHESLANTWTRLRRWRDEAREELVLSEELESAARLWEKRGSAADEVWKGEALADALRRLAPVMESLPELSRRFLAAGQRRAERERGRKRLVVGVGFVLLAFAAVSAVGVAFTISGKEREVRKQRNEAERGRAEALIESATGSLQQGDPAEARAKLRSALAIHDDARARALWWKLRRDPLVWRQRCVVSLAGPAWLPGGHEVVSTCNGRLERFDLSTLRDGIGVAAPFRPWALVLSLDGRRAVTQEDDGGLTVFDLERRSVMTRLEGVASRTRITAPSFNPDGSRLAFSTASAEGQGDAFTVAVVEVASGHRALTLQGHSAEILAVAYAPSGGLLASVSEDETVRVWDAESGAAVQVLTAQQTTGLAFSSDGRTLVSVGSDNRVRGYDPRTGAVRFAYSPCPSRVIKLALSSDGRTMAVGLNGGAIQVLSDAGGRVRELAAAGPVVAGLAFSLDGRYLAAVDAERWLRVWDLGAIDERRPTGPEGEIGTLAASPEENLILTGDEMGGVWLWDARDGTPISRLGRHVSAVTSLTVAPSGLWAVSADSGGMVQMWDLRRRVTTGSIEQGARINLSGLAISPDERTITIASRDGVLRSVNARGGIPLWSVHASETNRTTWVTAVAYTPDGRELATAQSDSVLTFRSSLTGEVRQTLSLDSTAVTLALSPDGQHVATGGQTNIIQLTDRAGGPLRRLTASSARVQHVLFAGNDRLVSAEFDNLSVYDLQTDRPSTVIGMYYGTTRAAISGETVVSMAGASIMSWDLRSGRPRWGLNMALPDPAMVFTRGAWTSMDDGLPVSLPSTQWRSAAEERSHLGNASPDGSTLCWLTFDGHLEMWDRVADRRLLFRRVPSSVYGVISMADACITMDEQPPRKVYLRDGEAVTLPDEAWGIDRTDHEILIQVRDQIEVRDVRGGLLARYPSHGEFAAGMRTPEVLAVAYGSGTVEVTQLGARGHGAVRHMTRVSTTIMDFLSNGPGGTLVGADSTGLVVAWDIATGVVIAQTKAVGAVVALYVRGNRVYAATDAGQSALLDLSEFATPYCDVMRDVWSAIPVEWEHGAAVPRATPRDHVCSPR